MFALKQSRFRWSLYKSSGNTWWESHSSGSDPRYCKLESSFFPGIREAKMKTAVRNHFFTALNRTLGYRRVAPCVRETFVVGQYSQRHYVRHTLPDYKPFPPLFFSIDRTYSTISQRDNILFNYHLNAFCCSFPFRLLVNHQAKRS